MQASNTNFETSDIIATIEYEASNHLARHPEMKVPPCCIAYQRTI